MYLLSNCSLSSPSRSGIIQAHKSGFSFSGGLILLCRTTSVVWLRAPGWNNKKFRTRAGAISVLCATHKKTCRLWGAVKWLLSSLETVRSMTETDIFKSDINDQHFEPVEMGNNGVKICINNGLWSLWSRNADLHIHPQQTKMAYLSLYLLYYPQHVVLFAFIFTLYLLYFLS